MSKYETYKSSGIEWMGEIPESWLLKRTKHFYSSCMGETILNEDLVNDAHIPVYSATESDTIFGYVEKASVILESGDIIIPARGNSIGNIKLVDKKCTCTQTTIYSKQISKRVSPSFIFYYYSGLKGYLFQFDNTAIPQITVRQVSNNPIVLPTYDEQLTIANYLDNQTLKIDRLIANKKAQAEKLKELRKIEINNAVTKGLNPNAEMKDCGIDWMGKIPKHWDTNRLKNVTYINQEVITEKTSPDYELKYIDIGNVTSNGEFLELQEMTFSEAPSRARRKPKHNSIILSTVRTYLRAIAFVQKPDDNLIASTGFAVIDAYENLFDAKYLFYQMTSHIVVERVIANSDGVSYPAISSTKLGDMKIILPPKEEQELISKYLEDRTSAIDKLIKNIDAQIEKLQELRKIKIYEAVTGKIKVNAYVEATA
jgi:type I restriction enzyme S subunit